MSSIYERTIHVEVVSGCFSELKAYNWINFSSIYSMPWPYSALPLFLSTGPSKVKLLPINRMFDCAREWFDMHSSNAVMKY